MTTECQNSEEMLYDALLAHEDPGAIALPHLEGCARCRALRLELVALARDLDAVPGSEASPALCVRTLHVARLELSAAASAIAPLPDGFRRELLRLIGGAIVPLPLVIAWNFALVFVGSELLATWLPAWALTGIAGFYALAAAGWLALVYGSLPLLAHRRVRQRPVEALT